MILVENVVKTYRRGRESVQALDGVSLEMTRGRLVLIQGPSGSGKTTLINVIAGLTRPSSGRVFVNGCPMDEMGRRQCARLRARHMAVVFQLFHLTPYLTALENTLLPTLVAPVPEARERALGLLRDLGIGHRTGHLPGEMSAGERQRCALARALLTGPELILADEPTGNLDEESAAIVLGKLGECRKAGAAVLLVSHQPVEKMLPDEVWSLRGGKLQVIP